jgi:hypothetical protein
LVEHLGRPGLVLFAAVDGRRPLSAWHTSGREGEREFMLMVPSDAQGQRLLQPLGSADWTLVTGLAACVHQHVQTEPGNGPWPTVAARLCRQLADLPPRLRYDTLNVQSVEGAVPGFDVNFGAATFGTLELSSIALRWQPALGGPQQGAVLWRAPADATLLPLSAWPVGPDGQLVSNFELPVGPGQPAGAKRRLWADLGDPDRDLVLAVLDALPAAAERVASAGLTAQIGRQALVQAATALHKDARRLLSAMQWRRAARRILRRGAARPRSS